MYCKKCGAVVSGKFCSNCGTRVRTDFEEFRLAERKARRDFINNRIHEKRDGFRGLSLLHLADACWTSSSERYLSSCTDIGKYDPHAYECLESTKKYAEKLYNFLVLFW